MSKEFVRRDILKMGMGAAACAAVGVLGSTSPAEAGTPAILFCARESSSDMHKTTKADSDTRKYSASLDKMKVFMDKMKDMKPAFLIELGDFVDTLAPVRTRRPT